MPLLCKQVQLLADHCWAVTAVCRCSSLWNSESRTASDEGQPLPSVHEELVTEMQTTWTVFVTKSRHHWCEGDEFITCFVCGWYWNQDGQNSTKIASKVQDFAHKGKTGAQKTILWITVLCYFSTVVWGFFFIHGYLRKSLGVLYSDQSITGVSHTPLPWPRHVPTTTKRDFSRVVLY